MNQIRKILLAGTMLCATVAQPVRAESLGDAIADAYRNNPQLDAQRADLRALDERVIQAGAPYRLNANIIGSLTYTDRFARQFDFFGNRGPFVNLKEKTLGVSLTANQILSNGGRTAAQVSVAEANVLSGRERLREVENFILLEVVDAYASVRRDTELVSIQEQTVASYERQVSQAEARERGGDLTRTDIAQAQAQLLIIRTQLAQARANLEQSRARFATVVGRSPGVLDPEPALPGLPISIDSAYKVAEAESPSLLQFVLNEKAARSQIAAERAERRPTLAVEGRAGYNNNSSYATQDLGRAFVGVATLTIPLAQGGLVGSRIREAIARQQQATFQIEASRRSVYQSVQNSWNQSVTARDLLSSGEEAVIAAQNALRGVRRGFSEGFRSNFEVLDSEQRLLNAQLIVANARYSRFSSQAALLAYLGRLQAAAVLEAVSVYDAAENLRRRKAQQIEPLGPIVKTIDNLQVPGRDSPPAPQLAPASGPGVAPAQVPAPSGPLANTIPITPQSGPATPPAAPVAPPGRACITAELNHDREGMDVVQIARMRYPSATLAAACCMIGLLSSQWPGPAAAQSAPRPQMGERIAARPNARVRDRDVRESYRLFDDKGGTATGGQFERIRATVDRGGFRFRGDSANIVLRDVDLTLRQPTNAPELPAGVEIQGQAHDILLERVVARNFQMVPRPEKYTNGDGFSTERETARITFRDSKALDNSDGGFDLKSTDTRLENTEAARNARNYRLWGTGEATTIKSIDPGQAHLELNPMADWHIATLVASSRNKSPVIVVKSNGRLRIDRCVLDVPAGTQMLRIENGWKPDIQLGAGCRAN